jgi:hypothetical protein
MNAFRFTHRDRVHSFADGWFRRTWIGWTSLAFAAALMGCADADGHSARPEIRRTGSLAEREWEVREYKVERYLPIGHHLEALSFRSGGGLTTLLQRAPNAAWGFMFGTPSHPVGGVVPLNGADLADLPGLGTPIDVVGVTSDGVSVYLDSDSGRIVSRTVSARGGVVARIRTPGSAQSACLLGEARIAYISVAHPDTIFIQDIDADRPPRAIVFPGGYVDGDVVRWKQLRFGGSNDGGCVLSAPMMSTVVLVTDSLARALGPFIEPAIQESRWHRLGRIVTREPAPRFALDATTFRGGVAVLFGGYSAGRGLLVDLYEDDGRYVETIVLPRPALKIAGNAGRLFVLSEAQDSILVASYFLPTAVRSTAVDSSFRVDTKLSPRWLKMLH